MTATISRAPESASNGHGGRPTLDPAPTRTAGTRANRTRIAVGLVVLALSVLGVVTLVGRSNERVPVLAVGRNVPAGAVLDQDDLVTVDMPTDTGLSLVQAARTNEVVGRTAGVSLIAGTILTTAHLADEPRVPEGMALLGAILEPGQYPVGLRPADQVEMIEAHPLAAGSVAQPIVAHGLAEVRALAEPSTGSGALVVSLLVPESAAGSVAAAGADGRLSLVVVGMR